MRIPCENEQSAARTLAAAGLALDAAALERRFCELLCFDTKELKRWIRAGVYRFTHSYPEVA